MRTIRYRESAKSCVQLGYIKGDLVYNVSRLIPEWTDPVTAWSVLRALGKSPVEAFERFTETSPATNLSTLIEQNALLSPVAAQEVWAAGVTYERSREARNAETKLQDSVYDRVYDAIRPEIFFKATYERLVSPGHEVGLRSDSNWMVPEPELAVVISSDGDVIGWTLGNDLSSRDIEGENPLYLPQAKIFSRSCSVGPAMLWNTGVEQQEEWTLSLTIYRSEQVVFTDSVSIQKLRRSTEELIHYLIRDNPVPNGTILLTGTGIVPPDDFTLMVGDAIEIAIDEIGCLYNFVAPPLDSTNRAPSGSR